jgi:predicted nuclease of predicted toxin-antitoxin system
MLRFLADHNLNALIVTALRARAAPVDVVSARDVGLAAVADPQLLAWAAEDDRIVLSHDVQTLPAFAAERLERGESLPGLILIAQSQNLRRIVDDLDVINQCSTCDEWRNRIEYLPL